MKSKEIIRNTILAYTNQIWGTKKIERLDILVQMMIANLTNELYLIQNDLDNLDSTLLDKIISKLTPSDFVAVRPAHTIIYMKPNYPIITLEQSNIFTLEWFDNFNDEEKNDAIEFHPVAEFNLFDIKITTVLKSNTAYTLDTANKKKDIQTKGILCDNSIWLGLNIGDSIDNIKNLFFFIDFPKLSEIHELYDILPDIVCVINGDKIKLKQGLPILKASTLQSDQDILHLYNDHFLYIDQDVFIKDYDLGFIPNELENIINFENNDFFKSQFWIKFEFPAFFTTNILEHATIHINCFPISNRRLIETSIIKDNLSKVTTLFSDKREKLLSINSIVDTDNRLYHSDIAQINNDIGTYHLETISPIFFEEISLIDYIEQLLNLLHDERSVFKGVNRDLVLDTLSVLTKTSGNDLLKPKINFRREDKEVVRLSINTYENANTINVDYWLTYGAYVNNCVMAGSIFIPDKSTKLEGLLGISLFEVHGGKEFSDIQDIMSIDRYIFTSKDRIVTNHDIKCFCESELGRAVENVSVRLGGKISSKRKEGIIRVINIDLQPSKNIDLFYTRGVLKSLKVRLKERSPHDYIYEINILN